MKKIISGLAIAIMLFACSKTESPVPSDQESALKKGKPGGGGGGPTLVVTTDEASYILPFGATCGGEVSKSGGGDQVIERGVCYNLTGTPTIADSIVPSGSGSGTFTTILSWLDADETYYARAYANKSKKGTITTTYGNEVSFTTSDPDYGEVTDIDGNTYTTIQIGTQVWMLENLKTTTYRDGTPIPEVTDDVLWAGLSSGAYCNYGNNEANGATYGLLYNGYAVDDSRNIAPEGWHVATGDEVDALLDYVGGGSMNDVSGGKLKEAGTVHWWSPNNANNSSGFTALPGGFRAVDPTDFRNLGIQGRFWASDPSGAGNLDYFWMRYNHAVVMGSLTGDFYPTSPTNPYDKRNGYAVRCVQD